MNRCFSLPVALILAMWCGTRLQAQDAGLREEEKEEVFEIVQHEIDRLGVYGSIQWIANAQRDDGTWPAHFAKDNPKRSTLSTNHATALGLLALLGAGQTHKDGRWKKEVGKGLNYLADQVREEEQLGDLRGGGDLEGHGAAALALCEAYGMTHDRKLLAPAQFALRFTERSQNETGGWGSQPGKIDDMHQAGWHVLTMRSGWMHFLLIRERTMPRLDDYLNSQQLEDGRWYSRVMNGRDAKATAIGLLGRIETGWNPEKNEHWQAGAAWLASVGPSEHDAEFNFWATQVLRHAGGDNWNTWNEKMREQMLETQWKTGGHRGSWFDPEDRHADRGRLYQTALNTMTMEIYYRHLTVYRQEWKAMEEEKPDAPEAAEDPFQGVDPFRG